MACAAREKISCIGLVNSPVDTFEVDLRVAFGGFCRAPLFESEPRFSQDGESRILERVIWTRHPKDAAFLVELNVPKLFVVPPKLERSSDHLGIDEVRTVGATDDPRLTTGARARVAGPPSVNERRVYVLAVQVQRGPPTKGTRPDNGDSLGG